MGGWVLWKGVSWLFGGRESNCHGYCGQCALMSDHQKLCFAMHQKQTASSKPLPPSSSPLTDQICPNLPPIMNLCIPRTERASSVIWTKGFSYINSDMVERITTPSFHFFYMVHNIHPLFIHASVFFYNEFYNVRKVSTILSFSVLKWLLLLCFWHKNTWFFQVIC